MSHSSRPAHVAGSLGPRLRSFGRLLSYATTADKALMIVGAIASLCAGATLPMLSMVFGSMVNHFNRDSISMNETKNNLALSNSTTTLTIDIIYLFLLKLTLGYFSTFVFRMAGIRISSALRTTYFDAILKQSVGTLDGISAGHAVDCMGQTANTIQGGINEKLALLVQSVALIVTGFVVAVIHSWALSLAMVSATVVILLVYYLFIKFQGPLEVELEHTTGEASAVAYEVIRNIRTVKSLNAENAAHFRYQKLIDRSQNIATKLSPWVAMQAGLVLFALHGGLALGLWLGVKLYVQGTIERLGDVVVTFSSILLVAGQLGSLFNPLYAIMQATVASTALFRIIDAPQPSRGGSMTASDLSSADLIFESVQFAYPDRRDFPVLHNLNMCITGGQTTALVGLSGCGKSTIVALLERWYQLSEPPLHATEHCLYQHKGVIRANEHDINSYDLKWWRSQIGLVQQEPFLFNDTILSNVAFGLVGTPWEAESEATKRTMVEEACRTALADSFIALLPDGYETQVGDGGIGLSGGQRQRLAIARAIIKRPSILILDEATSAIDVRLERSVQEALDQAALGRTTIMITHRLNAIKGVECIILMDNGHVVASGTHEKLMADVVQYARMVETQELEMPEAGMNGTSQCIQEETRASRVDMNPIPAPDTPPNRYAYRWRLHWRNVIGGTRRRAEPASDQGRWHPLSCLVWEQRHRFRALYLTIFISVCTASTTLALQPFVLSHYLLVFAQPLSAHMEAAGSFWALMAFVIALAMLVSSGALAGSVKILSAKMTAQISSAYFANIIRKETSWFDHKEHSCGTVTAQLSNDARQLQQCLGLSMPLLSLFSLVGCYLLATSQGWKMSIVVAAAAIPLIVGAGFVRVRHELTFTKRNSKLFLDSSMFASEAIGAIRTVTSLTLEEFFLKRYKKLLEQNVQEGFRQARIACFVFALSDSVDMLCIALTIWYGGELVARREYGTLQFYMIYYALIQGSQAAGQHLAYSGIIGAATEAAARIVDMGPSRHVEVTGQVSDRVGGGVILQHPTDSPNAALASHSKGFAIEARNVSFRYPSRDIPVCSALSLSVSPGEFVGIVGASGCGKTTVLSLLSRLYPVTTGEILVGGLPIESIPRDVFHQIVSIVRQEPALLPGSILENLTFGLPEGRVVMQEELELACRLAAIHDYIVSLPRGYNTKLQAGPNSSLSSGQKQRICIARALLRQPQVLLLDEVTSYLDSCSELAIQRTIERLNAGQNMTMIVVAHRLSLIANAHRIFVLGKDGGLVEEGTHKDLVSKKGTYWQMCLAQKCNG